MHNRLKEWAKITKTALAIDMPGMKKAVLAYGLFYKIISFADQ